MMSGKKTKIRPESGFTLIEMAIVTSIFGFLMVAALQIYRMSIIDRQYTVTKENMTLTQDAIREFYGLMGRFPGPADPTLVPGDIGYGLEMVRASVTAACPAGIVCQNTGTRDADGDTVNDPVLIGSVPVVTLSTYNDNRLVPFQEVSGRDGFGMKLSYAVTDNMTRGDIVSPANPNLGAINVRDENNQSLTELESSTLFVVISHGKNKVGAIPRIGSNVVEDCSFPSAATPGDPPPSGFNPGTAGIKVDRENCDLNDAIFVSGLRTLADTDAYYDDLIYITTNASNPIWRKSLNSPIGLTWINNTNLRFVGVGTNTPVEPLHTTGDIRAEDTAIADNGFCDYNGEPVGRQCMQPSFVAAPAPATAPVDHAKKCGPGRIATGIEDNELVCKDLFSATLNFNCPSGPPQQFVTGFRVDSSGILVPGSVTCAVVP